MNINYSYFRKLTLKAYCFDQNLIMMYTHLYHIALVYDREDRYYYLLEYSDSLEDWYILHDGIDKGWLQDKFNQRSAEIDEDLAGLIDL
ncbi:MAG: hypothetical protein J6T62_07515 [Fibrobacter sp.]|nr:hypothetical protein [Fibrobacter sp.]